MIHKDVDTDIVNDYSNKRDMDIHELERFDKLSRSSKSSFLTNSDDIDTP